jgi:hypothetical protein
MLREEFDAAIKAARASIHHAAMDARRACFFKSLAIVSARVRGPTGAPLLNLLARQRLPGGGQQTMALTLRILSVWTLSPLPRRALRR